MFGWFSFGLVPLDVITGLKNQPFIGIKNENPQPNLMLLMLN